MKRSSKNDGSVTEIKLERERPLYNSLKSSSWRQGKTEWEIEEESAWKTVRTEVIKMNGVDLHLYHYLALWKLLPNDHRQGCRSHDIIFGHTGIDDNVSLSVSWQVHHFSLYWNITLIFDGSPFNSILTFMVPRNQFLRVSSLAPPAGQTFHFSNEISQHLPNILPQHFVLTFMMLKWYITMMFTFVVLNEMSQQLQQSLWLSFNFSCSTIIRYMCPIL